MSNDARKNRIDFGTSPFPTSVGTRRREDDKRVYALRLSCPVVRWSNSEPNPKEERRKRFELRFPRHSHKVREAKDSLLSPFFAFQGRLSP